MPKMQSQKITEEELCELEDELIYSNAMWSSILCMLCYLSDNALIINIFNAKSS